MNSFDAMGHAQLQIADANSQMADALSRWVATVADRVLHTLGRHLPSIKTRR